MLDFYQGTGYLAYRGEVNDLSFHKHNALQITVALNTLTVITESESIITEGIILSPNTHHKISCSNAFIILIEAESHFAATMKDRYLKNSSTFVLSGSLSEKLKKLIESDISDKLIDSIFSLFINDYCIKRHYDNRISNILDWIDTMESEGRWDEITLKNALNLVCLSESRYLHLFSQEIGVTWRPYLLWRRLLSAVNRVIDGYSMTESAIYAGFSDSAHFSRVFRSTFGMSPTEAYTNLKK